VTPQERSLTQTRELVERAASGNAHALEALLARYRPRLTRWAAGRLPANARGKLDTQDLVQETLIAVAVRLPELAQPEAFPAYLRRALLNRLLDLGRRQQPPDLRLDTDFDAIDARPTPGEQALSTEQWDLYERALAALAPREQLAVMGRLEWGLTHAELAEELGLATADAARMAATRAVAHLVRQLAR
jgi:RNA polymerase sigma-70 factor, ECF subfamily